MDIMTGELFGLLKVISKEPAWRAGRAYWLCLCVCGNQKLINGQSLRVGASKSCGCARNARNRVSALSHGMARRGSRATEYATWCRMIDRCENPKIPNFDNYGGRGIRVCRRWRRSFVAFLKDLGPRPSNRHSLERDDTNGNYTPRNCRWATKAEQSSNTRRSKVWLIHGERFNTCTEAGLRYGVSSSTIMRWCNGFFQNHRKFPPRTGCSATLKYGVRS